MGLYASTGKKDMNNSQRYSYTNNPPVQGLCAAAGGEPDGTKCQQSIYFSVNIGDECLEYIVPYWFVEKKAVDEKWDASATSRNPFESQKENWLFMAKGP
jgi:hypothetical protein